METTIKFKSTFTKMEYVVKAEDLEDSNIYFHFPTLELDLPDGEYEYKIYSDNNILLASGLARVGNYKTNNTEYDGTERKYTEYNG